MRQGEYNIKEILGTANYIDTGGDRRDMTQFTTTGH